MDILNHEFLFFLECAGKNSLRYLLIGGYAVNYFGFHRYTNDMDVWIAPTEGNKQCFLSTLRCMNYHEDEIKQIENQDFTTHFMCTLGEPPHVIDVLTIVHRKLSFDEAEQNKHVHLVGEDVELHVVSYETLKDIKLRSDRKKDLYDIEMLEKLRKEK